MHIVIDARMIDASGIGVYIDHMIDGIIEIHQITLLGDPNKLARYKGRTHLIRFVANIYSLKEQWQFRQIVPECDIFWSPHYNVPLMPVRAKKRLVTIHDVFHLAFSKQLSVIQRIYAHVVINAAVRLSDRVITVSEFSKSELIKYTSCKNSKISVIYNGVKNVSLNDDFARVCERYTLPQRYILYVGNVKPHKNLKKLLEAYLLLSSGLQQEFKIVIVGKKDGFITQDNSLFDWLDENSLLKKHVIFTGFVTDEDLDSIYQKASVFVFPSLYEGFGLPPLEAMINGCPVAVSTASCIPEICAEAAVYFNPDNAYEISEQITAVLKNKKLRVTLAERGLIHARLFPWEKSVRDHLVVLSEVNSHTQKFIK